MSTMVILCLLVLIPASRLVCFMRRRIDHVSHLESTVTGTLLVNNARIQLLSFLYIKILHVRHPSYLFGLFHFASSARTRNFTVPPVKWLPTLGRFVLALRGMYRCA
jgi:hypothetical protein